MIMNGSINLLKLLYLYDINPINNDINRKTVLIFPYIELLFLLNSLFFKFPDAINFVQLIIIIINSSIKVIIKFLLMAIINVVEALNASNLSPIASAIFP